MNEKNEIILIDGLIIDTKANKVFLRVPNYWYHSPEYELTDIENCWHNNIFNSRQLKEILVNKTKSVIKGSALQVNNMEIRFKFDDDEKDIVLKANDSSEDRKMHIKSFTNESRTHITRYAFSHIQWPYATINFPNVKVMYTDAFQTSQLHKMNARKLEDMWNGCFNGSTIKEVSMPNLKIMGDNNFRDCEELKVVTMGELEREYGTNNFKFCPKLNEESNNKAVAKVSNNNDASKIANNKKDTTKDTSSREDGR